MKVIREHATAINAVNVPLREFKDHARSICKIEQLPALGRPINVGTGFLFWITNYGEKDIEHYGIITCTHVMPNIYKIEDLNKYKYRFTFEGVEPKFDVKPQFIAKIHRTPEADKSTRLDVTFLEFDIEAIRNEPAADFLSFLEPVTYEGDRIATKEAVYKTDSELFSVHYAHGYELYSASGRLEDNTWKNQLLTHSLSTDKGSSGAPLIDVSTKRVIAVHRCDVRSPESRNNWHLYPNGATNILPVVDYIKGITNYDYIVNTSTEQAESMDDPDGSSVAASASARQFAGRPHAIISSNFNNNNSIISPFGKCSATGYCKF